MRASPRRVRLPAFLAFFSLLLSLPAAGSAQSGQEAWVEKSNENAQVLLEVFARFSPEGAGQLGVPGLDEEIFDLQPGLFERSNQATEKALAVLRERLEAETDPAVRQDLEILIAVAEESIEGSELNRKYNLPYFNLSQTVFRGIRSLLDDQVEPERRAAALVRLRKYAGLEDGYTPIAELAMDRIRERLTLHRL